MFDTTPANLPHVLLSFKTARVLVVGDLMIDEYVTGRCERLSPEAPVPVLEVHRTRAVLGGAANTAANVAALGGKAVLFGLVGEDDAGRTLRHLCEQQGVDLHSFTDGRPTTRKVRVTGGQQQMLRLDHERPGPASAAVESALIEGVVRHVAEASALVVSDYAKGAVTEELCRALIEHARQKGIPLIVDPRPQHRAFYRGCDVIAPNWREALGLLGEPDAEPTEARVADVGQRLAAALESTVVLTLGGKGVRVFPRGGGPMFAVAATAREVFDVSGAGDTVVATLSLGLAVGLPVTAAVELANRAAGIAVGKLGTATVSPPELLGDEHMGRLVTREDLASLADALREGGKRIVTINGSFDVLHAGHLHILEEARRQGDVLIVGLNSDASVRAYKGAGRPIVPHADRARLLLALRTVDYVHVFDEAAPMAFLDVVRPDVHVNGAEYGTECIEADTVRRHGGRLHLVDRVEGLSTTDLLKRIADAVAGAHS